MISDTVLAYIFRILNTQTALLISKYSEDESVINDLYASFLVEMSEEEVLGILNYFTKLISFLEQKEDYEWCAKLLKLKNQIKKYNDE